MITKRRASSVMFRIGAQASGRGQRAAAGYVIAVLAVLVAACSDPAQAHIDGANELLGSGDIQGAIAALEAGTQANPDSASAWNNLGNLYSQEQRSDEALYAFRRAIQADPGRLEPHYNLAGLLVDLERNEEAVEEFDRALQIDPSKPEIHYNLAYTLYRLDRFDKAWERLEEARRRGAAPETVEQLAAAIQHFYTPPAVPSEKSPRR